MVKRKWFTVAPLVAVLRAWARRLERGEDDESAGDLPVELNSEVSVEEKELWPPAAG